MRRDNPLRDRSVELSVSIITLVRDVRARSHEFALCDQLIRSGTAPGALIAESADSESPADMVHKLSIALKEARETEYWLEVFQRCELADLTIIDTIRSCLNEVISMLIASKRTLRSRLPPKH
jgi:four helix bundle protein